MVHPNFGEIYDAVNKNWILQDDCPQSHEDFARLAVGWYAAGARVIGGCCRTNPITIRNIGNELEKVHSRVVRFLKNRIVHFLVCFGGSFERLHLLFVFPFSSVRFVQNEVRAAYCRKRWLLRRGVA